jgi:hypothetical protein
MLYSEIIAVCSQIQTKHINTLCGQNVELLNVKLAVPRGYNGLIFSKAVRLTEQKVSLVCSYRHLSLQYSPAVSPNVPTFPQNRTTLSQLETLCPSGLL